MPVYIATATTSIIAPDKATAQALANDPNTQWITTGLRDIDGGDLLTDDDHHAYHRAVETARLTEGRARFGDVEVDAKSLATWVGDQA